MEAINEMDFICNIISYVSEQNEYVLICCFQSKQTRKSLRSEYKDQTTIE